MHIRGYVFFPSLPKSGMCVWLILPAVLLVPPLLFPGEVQTRHGVNSNGIAEFNSNSNSNSGIGIGIGIEHMKKKRNWNWNWN
jgi:hypothetical protein